MNIKTQSEYRKALKKIQQARIVVVDTETNTLRIRQTAKPMVSLQVYLPEFDVSYNFPFRQGHGVLELSDGTPVTRDTWYEYPKMSWTGRDKRTVLLDILYRHWQQENPEKLGNIHVDDRDPNEMDELIGMLQNSFTPEKTYIFHNANFDLAVLWQEGFPQLPNVEDTMIALQIVWGDWGGNRNADDKGIRVRMPERYYDAEKADREGKEWGNRQLKWQARFWDLDNADVGENALSLNALDFCYELADWAINDTYKSDRFLYLLDGITYASWKRDPYSTDSAGVTWHDRQVQRLYEKIKWNDKELKGRLWMLPSDQVSLYGEMDVILTSQLYDKLLWVIDAWGSRDIYNKLSRINIDLCWRMEQNGVLIDLYEASHRIERNLREAEKLADNYDWNIDSWQEFKSQVGDDIGLPNTQAATLKAALDLDIDEEYKQVIRDRLEYKRIIKNTSTYLSRWVDAADESGYGHFKIDPVGTKTGRATSGGDMGNGQNIPDRSSRVKEVIITPEEHLVFGIDYSNLELRVGAWMAEQIHGFDPNYTMSTIIDREDAHTYTTEMLGVRDLLYPNLSDAAIAKYNNMTGWQEMDDETLHKRVYKSFLRQVGKTCNFALMYNGSHWALGLQLGVSFEDEDANSQFEIMKELHTRWHNLFPAFSRAQKHYEREALTPRPTPTGLNKDFQYTLPIMPIPDATQSERKYMYGRPIKHHLYDTARWVKNKYNGEWEQVDIKAYSASKAWNNAVQGTSGLICLESGWNFYQLPTVDNDGVKLFVNIHDALDGYARCDRLEQVYTLMCVMENWNVKPKLTVELEAGLDNWQHMQEVKDINLWIESGGELGYE